MKKYALIYKQANSTIIDSTANVIQRSVANIALKSRKQQALSELRQSINGLATDPYNKEYQKMRQRSDKQTAAGNTPIGQQAMSEMAKPITKRPATKELRDRQMLRLLNIKNVNNPKASYIFGSWPR